MSYSDNERKKHTFPLKCHSFELSLRQRNAIMTTLQLNAELFHELSTIVTDEDMMRKAIKALKRIIDTKGHEDMEADETGYILSSPAMVDIIKQGDAEIKQGNLQPVNVEDLWK